MPIIALPHCIIVTLCCMPRYDPALYEVQCTMKSQIQKDGEDKRNLSRATLHMCRVTNTFAGKSLIANKRSLHHELQVL